jgi:hypothetical protein
MTIEELNHIRSNAQSWYDSYASVGRVRGLEVVITPHFTPNPINPGLYVFGNAAVLDGVTKNVAKFLRDAGMRPIVSGPTGLGAAISVPVSMFVSIFRWAIGAAGYIVKVYRQGQIKKAKPLLTLSLELCVPTANGELREYAKKFVVCVAELIKSSSNVVPYINVQYSASVNDLASGEVLHFNLKDASDLSVLRQLRKVDKRVIVA